MTSEYARIGGGENPPPSMRDVAELVEVLR